MDYWFKSYQIQREVAEVEFLAGRRNRLAKQLEVVSILYDDKGEAAMVWRDIMVNREPIRVFGC